MANTVVQLEVKVDPEVYALIERVMKNIQQIETLLEENKKLLAEAVPHALRLAQQPDQPVD